MKMVELSNIKESLGRFRDIDAISGKLYTIRNDYWDIDNPNILEMVPVKIVSFFEEYFRLQYQRIIDETEDRAYLKENLRGIKFDFETLDTLYGRNISMGEYLSYSFSCNNIEDVNSNFSKLLNINFLKHLKQHYSVPAEENITIEEYDNRFSNLISSISKIFKKRHIICHEGGLREPINNEIALQMIEDAIKFFECVSSLCYHHFEPNPPLTERDIEISTESSYNKTQSELNNLIEKIEQINKSNDIAEGFGFIKEWEAYRENRSIIAARNYEEGTFFSIIYCKKKEEITRSLIEELESKYRTQLRTLNYHT